MRTVVTGGVRLGMMTARPKCLAVCGTTDRMAAPSRTCRCQSSGRVMVRVVMDDDDEEAVVTDRETEPPAVIKV